MAEQRNPVEMTEEEIAESNGEPLPQPTSSDEVPSALLDDPPPARLAAGKAGARHVTGP